ncbi:MAG: lipoyl(octanoyl) transferase LipB [Desulfonatronovibrio sp.]
MQFIDLGIISYKEALERQMNAVREVISNKEAEQVFLLEHFPVITAGRRQAKDNLIVGIDKLKEKNIDFIETTRGGDITCHFPGQLVVYPVMRLNNKVGALRDYFSFLEEVIINLLKKYCLSSWSYTSRPGVYTDSGKIASIGIGVKKWVTYHGLAINLTRKLSLFDYINPCGMTDIKMTSIHAELGSNYLNMAQLKADFIIEFKKYFIG